VKLKNVLDAVLGSIKVDEGMTSRTFLDLGGKLRNLSNSGVTYAQVPLASVDHQVPNWGSTVLWDEEKARVLFDAIRQDKDPGASTRKPKDTKATAAPGGSASGPVPVEVAPDQVTVRVFNGTSTQGLGTRAHNDLAGLGFSTAGSPRNSTAGDGVRTIIRFDPKWDRSVETVKAALPGAVAEPVTGLGGTIEVIVGSSYAGVTAVRVAPAADETPTTDTTGNPAYSSKSGDEVSCKK